MRAWATRSSRAMPRQRGSRCASSSIWPWTTPARRCDPRRRRKPPSPAMSVHFDSRIGRRPLNHVGVINRLRGPGMRRSGKVSLALALASQGFAVAAPAQTVVATIDAGKRSDPVTKYEYGMFIEPIGSLVARTLWAEMLDDRKFYYPIVAAARDVPPPPSVEGRPGVVMRKWRPIGADDAVAMDGSAPYVGAQSPSVAVQGAPRGFGQGGIGIAGGRLYNGYLLLSGDSSARVQVALVWGDGPQDRQIVALPAPTAAWQRVPFSFTPGTDAAAARLEITGTGS